MLNGETRFVADGLIEGSVDDIDPKEWMVPAQCIPVHANVVTYDWEKMYNHTQFDVIMMDPPWQVCCSRLCVCVPFI